MLFGKKPEINSSGNLPGKSAPTVSVQTIPADFYGGVNPVVKFKKVEKEIVLEPKQKLTAPEKKMLDKSTAAGVGAALHPANILANKKYAIIFGSVLFVAIAAGVSVYYYAQLKKPTTTPSPLAPKVSAELPAGSAPAATETTTTEIVVPTTTETQPISLAEAPMEFPSSLLGDSADLDNDNLTDVAEELFATDPSKPDTDEDSYNDGHEVFYLYNPAGKEPMRLVEAGTVQDYENPALGYKVYYPANWAVGNVDDGYRDVLFSTISGENIELRTFDLLPGESFADWFAKWAPNEQYSNLSDWQTKWQQVGKRRNDNLVYYFTDESHVYVLAYHTTDSNVVNYRSVIVMMARSFRTPGFTPPEIAPPVVEGGIFPTEMPSTI